MIDIHNINAKTHEFTGDEIGELLLASVRQMKQGEFARTHQLPNSNDTAPTFIDADVWQLIISKADNHAEMARINGVLRAMLA